MKRLFYTGPVFNTECSLGYLIKQVDKLSTSQIGHQFAGSDLTLAHWIALAMLRREVVDNCAGLSRQLGQGSGATTRLVDQLETRGLVRRLRGGADRRVVALSLTASGRERFRTLTPMVVGVWNETLEGFKQTEIETVIGLLSRLLVAFVAKEAAPGTAS